jgi:hypothetical protein
MRHSACRSTAGFWTPRVALSLLTAGIATLPFNTLWAEALHRLTRSPDQTAVYGQGADRWHPLAEDLCCQW